MCRKRRQSDTNDVTKTTTRHSSICIDILSSTRGREGGARQRNQGRKKEEYKIDENVDTCVEGAKKNAGADDTQLDRKEGTNHRVGETNPGKVNYELPEYLASKVTKRHDAIGQQSPTAGQKILKCDGASCQRPYKKPRFEAKHIPRSRVPQVCSPRGLREIPSRSRKTQAEDPTGRSNLSNFVGKKFPGF
ncbi:hypothetical protein M405DRAFT_847231 [Rhizopogon salebrosus TDB-379]|nr:hypothetical protein M405DRAFT_847231 [Rhizopogon salebrosus TDB-379]